MPITCRSTSCIQNRSAALRESTPVALASQADNLSVNKPLIAAHARARPQHLTLTLSSAGGGAHNTSADAVARCLGKDACARHSPFDTMTSLYNWALNHGFNRFVNLIVYGQRLQECTIMRCCGQRRMQQLFTTYEPAMVVSVQPLGNCYTWNSAQAAGVPMFIIPTDFCFDHFLHGIRNPDPSLKVCLPYDDATLIAPWLEMGFTEENFVVTGAALRPAFSLSEEDQESAVDELNNQLSINSTDPVVMIMMGARGVNARRVIQLVDELVKGLLDKTHIVVVCGRNESLRAEIGKMDHGHAAKAVYVHPLGYCDDGTIAALMHRSSVLLSKPGGATVHEALACNLRGLYDAHSLLHWERGNLEYVKERDWAHPLEPKPAEMVLQVIWALALEPLNISPCPGRHFEDRFRKLVGDPRLPEIDV